MLPSDIRATPATYMQQSDIGPPPIANTTPLFQNFLSANHLPVVIIITNIRHDRELSNLAKIYINNK